MEKPVRQPQQPYAVAHLDVAAHLNAFHSHGATQVCPNAGACLPERGMCNEDLDIRSLHQISKGIYTAGRYSRRAGILLAGFSRAPGGAGSNPPLQKRGRGNPHTLSAVQTPKESCERTSGTGCDK
jgi:hypothetical protein